MYTACPQFDTIVKASDGSNFTSCSNGKDEDYGHHVAPNNCTLSIGNDGNVSSLTYACDDNGTWTRARKFKIKGAFFDCLYISTSREGFEITGAVTCTSQH